MSFVCFNSEHCTFGGGHKNHNSAKNHSTKKPIKYAPELEIPINPAMFHSICISSISEVVQTNFQNKK